MTWLSTASEAATAVGVIFAGGALTAQLRQRKEALAQLYVERFWTILDQRHDRTGALVTEPAYVRLCEDEFENVRLGWIDAGTWEVWHDAMAAELKKAQGAELNDRLFCTLCARHTERAATPHAAHECDAMEGISWMKRARLNYGGRSARHAIAVARKLRDKNGSRNGHP